MKLLLNEKHHKILNANGHALVLGGPGSGKTTLALLKAANRIEKGLEPGQAVLFLSFSRAAVTRIADVVKDHIPKEARSLLSIQTFHSFFWEILQTHGHLLNAPKRLSILLAHEEKAARGGIDPDDPGWPEWEKARMELFQNQGKVCFDLFAPLTAELLTRAKRIRERVSNRYPLLLVDEAQDTGDHQWTCVRSISDQSQVICLADLDQLIFDHLPGVGPERVQQIRDHLTPVEIDLGTDNNRSPNTEIAVFGRDILHGHVRESSYKNVSGKKFSPKAIERNKAIRQSIGIANNAVKSATGQSAESIALIASYGRGVAVISAALRQDKEIPHQVLFDEAFVLLASRVGAFILEPKSVGGLRQDIATCLEMLADAQRAKGGKTALSEAAKCMKWAAKTRETGPPKVNLVKGIETVLASFAARACSGDPISDWRRVKQELLATREPTLCAVKDALDYLIAFNRGNHIASGLSELWLKSASYSGARAALDAALTQEQLISGGEQLHGIHVMNMHKCKGKQFDAVVLFRDQNNSPFVWANDPPPHTKSRKVLHVAITRARKHVLILQEASTQCPIINPHQL